VESESTASAPATAAHPLDQEKVQAFAERAFADLGATFTAALCVIGDRLGLFKDLAARGPATSEELAARTGIVERYAREWLSGMASAGYLTYDPAGRHFALPPEHAPVLAEEVGPLFMGAEYQQLQGVFGIFDLLLRAFREGGGVPQSAYHESFWDGLDRSSAIYCANFLVQQWIPAMPEVQAGLERGIAVADVGCGRGRALITLAQAYPNSHFVGYDIFEPTIAAATANAAAAGVGDRVHFAYLDAAHGLPEQYDFITTFDVIHDSADPLGLLRAIRAGLAPDGTYMCLEFNAREMLEEIHSPVGPYLYGASVFYCMTTSLAQGGVGLGTAGMPESRVREYCQAAGFGSVRRLPIEDPFRAIFAVKL
jgi:SAM-dependent methyltransferase